MQKYVAFNLYAKNDLGGCQPAGADGEMREVYLAADVDAQIANLREAFVAALDAELRNLRAEGESK